MPAALLVSWFALGALAFLGVCAIFVATSIRNRLIQVVAQAANIVANPLATLAAEMRSFSERVQETMPESAFSDGVMTRLFFAVTFFILLAVDAALATARLGAMFGNESESLPFDLSWATGLGWILAGGLLLAVSLDLRREVIGYPFDRLTPSAIRLLRIVTDSCFVAVVVSAVVFYALGALLLAGSAPVILSIIFQSLLGLALVVASGIAGWAGLEGFTTLYGVVLIVFSRLVRFVAIIPEQFVISLRRSAYLVMAAIDLPLLGVIYPVIRWWASSKFGKALGLPPIEEPVAWPPVGFVEPPAQFAQGEAPLSYLSPLETDLEELEYEDAA